MQRGGQRGSLVSTRGEQHDRARASDRAEALCDGPQGDVAAAVEVPGVVAARPFRERHDVAGPVDRCARFVEREVTVGAQAGDLYVDAAETDDGGEEVVYDKLPRRNRRLRVFKHDDGTERLLADGDHVEVGQQLMEGSANPHEVLRVQGPREVQIHLVKEVQEVYRAQGVSIHDKHIEVIVRQMLRRVTIIDSGSTEFLPGSLTERSEFETVNRRVVAESGEPAAGRPVLMGITKASLATDSWLSAASFQETTRVLTDAAINCRSDKLQGLKENVIIGKLIPAGTGIPRYRDIQVQPTEEARAAAYTIPSYEDQYYSPDFGQATGAAVPLDDYGYSDYR